MTIRKACVIISYLLPEFFRLNRILILLDKAFNKKHRGVYVAINEEDFTVLRLCLPTIYAIFSCYFSRIWKE